MRVREAVLRVALHALEDDPLDGDGDVLVELARRRDGIFLIELLAQHCLGRFTREGLAEGQQLVGGHAKGENVRPLVERLLAELLRSHVGGRAGVAGHPLGHLRQRLREVEVHQADIAGAGHQNVLRLEVEVDEALLVHVFQRQRHIDQNVADELAEDRVVPGDEVLEIRAGHTLEQSEVHSINLPVRIKADDERMPVNLLQDLTTTKELLASHLVHEAIAQQSPQRIRLAILVRRRPNLRRATTVDQLME